MLISPPTNAGMTKKEGLVRSSTLQFEVMPNEPVTLSIDANRLPDSIAVTNTQARTCVAGPPPALGLARAGS